MKLINRREIGLVSALFFPILFSPPALANLISTDLVELGKEYYQAGDYSRAIHELSKALLADPADEEAKKYLNKMGLKDGVYHQDKTPIDKIADLSNEVVNYQQQLSDLEQANVQHLQAKEALEQQNASLQESASSQNTENEILRRKLDQAHDDIKIQGKQTQEELAAAAKTAEKKNEQIVRLNTDLYQLKATAADHLTEVQQKAEQLAALEKQWKTAEHNWREKELDYKDQMVSLDDYFKKYKHNTVKTEADYKKQIKNLQTMLLKDRQELARLQDKFVISDFKLADRENKVAQRNRRIAELKDSIAQMEKDLAFCQTKVSANSVAMKAAPVSADTSNKEEDDKIVFIKKQDKLIAELKTKLISVQNKKSSASPNPNADAQRSGQIEGLKSELNHMRETVAAKEENLKTKSADYDILQQQLQDTKERLGVLEDMIQKKDTQISDLEKQLSESLPPAPPAGDTP